MRMRSRKEVCDMGLDEDECARECVCLFVLLRPVTYDVY